MYWKKFVDAADKARNMIQIAKNKCFRQFCDKLRTNEFSKATNKIKNIRRSKATTSTIIQDINGPQATVDKITDAWKNVYNGNNVNNIRNVNIETTLPDNRSTGYDQDLSFDVDNIKYVIKCLPRNKARLRSHQS